MNIYSKYKKVTTLHIYIYIYIYQGHLWLLCLSEPALRVGSLPRAPGAPKLQKRAYRAEKMMLHQRFYV